MSITVTFAPCCYIYLIFYGLYDLICKVHCRICAHYPLIKYLIYLSKIIYPLIYSRDSWTIYLRSFKGALFFGDWAKIWVKYKFINIYFPITEYTSCSQEKIMSPGQYLKLGWWQGPPHVYIVKQKLCCPLRSVCLFRRENVEIRFIHVLVCFTDK